MSEISTKEQILKFKDYADIADASYAMLHWVSENEKNGLDDLYSKRWKSPFGDIKTISERVIF